MRIIGVKIVPSLAHRTTHEPMHRHCDNPGAHCCDSGFHVPLPPHRQLPGVGNVVYLGAITPGMSRLFAPSMKYDRSMRSVLTEESAASSFAIRDWLDPIAFANWSCVQPLRSRNSLTLTASANLNSMSSISTGVNPRNSEASPTFHPAAVSRFAFCVSMVSFPRS